MIPGTVSIITRRSPVLINAVTIDASASVPADVRLKLDVPAGSKFMVCEAWTGGGGGQTSGNTAGGIGGTYCKNSNVSLVGYSVLYYQIGSGIAAASKKNAGLNQSYVSTQNSAPTNTTFGVRATDNVATAIYTSYYQGGQPAVQANNTARCAGGGGAGSANNGASTGTNAAAYSLRYGGSPDGGNGAYWTFNGSTYTEVPAQLPAGAGAGGTTVGSIGTGANGRIKIAFYG